MSRPLRIGILGTAKIARSFALGARPSDLFSIVAIASRSLDKARAFAADHHIDRAFGSYEELLADREIDAVYIPLPNSLHAQWSIEAVHAGKHVLCEKPLAVGAEQARTMFDAARDNGVHLVEGFPYLAQAQTPRLRELVGSGALGQLRLIQASFAFPLTDAENNIRLNPQLAGGSLLDTGVYPVSLIRILTGKNPLRVQATARWNTRDSGERVDMAMAATLEFDGGLLAQVTCGFDACLHRHAVIAGSNGVVQTSFFNHTSAAQPGDMQLRVGTDARAVDSVIQSPYANGFLAEAESFAALIASGASHWSGATEHESIDIACILESILRSARSGRAESVHAD